jgi:ATP-dependent DNA helicase RecQ
LPTFGVGKEHSKAQWQAIFRQMMGYDLIRPDPERHGGLRFTENARPLLKGEAQIQLRMDSIAGAIDREPRVKSLVSDENAPLLSALKAQRRALAEQQKVPAYIVFNDKTLIEMAERRPATLDDMASVSGVGSKKLERYGQTFLTIITGEEIKLHPIRRKMAGRPEADVFDRLLAAQKVLEKGEFETEKPLSCSTSTLRNIVKRQPNNIEELEQITGMNAARIKRFGPKFIEILRSL